MQSLSLPLCPCAIATHPQEWDGMSKGVNNHQNSVSVAADSFHA